MKGREFVKKLERQTATYFKDEGYSTAKCGYMLQNRKDWHKNIILPEVAKYIDDQKHIAERERQPFALHKYIHHGLSSQACLFNLLGYFVVNKEYRLLKNIVELSGLLLKMDISFAQLEFIDRGVFKEDKGQPTSIDLFIRTQANEHVITEFKFAEAEFGTCSVYEDGDCDGSNPYADLKMCYLHKLGRLYMTKMKENNLLKESESCPFTELYQAYRLLLFALHYGGDFLFISDERNPAFLNVKNGITKGKYVRFKQLLPNNIADRVYILSIQKIVRHLKDTCRYDWVNEFEKKYL